MTQLTIGTRSSPLARAQTETVIAALHTHHPQLDIRVVTITTDADEHAGTELSAQPLATLGTRNAFVKTIDTALLNGDIDVAVHSYKDIAIERPKGILTAAVPPRVDARDVVFFTPDALQQQTLTLGSSSPRRKLNTPTVLQELGLHCSMVDIRGNVHTRLRRIGADSIDGVVLALAGIIRLLQHPKTQAETQALLHNLACIVPPLHLCPTAPAQGALALECRTDDAATAALLTPLNHAASAKQVATERHILADYGGGCHLALGISKTSDFSAIRGQDEAGKHIHDITGTTPQDTLTIYENLWQHPDAKHWNITP